MRVVKYGLVLILGLASGFLLTYLFYFNFIYQGNTLSPVALLIQPFQNISPTSQPDQISKVPILLYHYVRISPESPEAGTSLEVRPEEFFKQIEYLYIQGYQTTSLDLLFAKQSGKKIIITFDDGYKDAIENAYPILKQYNYTATIYPIVNKIGKDGYLTWDDLRFLEKEGWTIGSHTLNHTNLKTADSKKAYNELVESKKQLESHLIGPVDHFCYPFGEFDFGSEMLVKSAGYKTAVATIIGKTNLSSEKFALKRIRISGTDTLEHFIKKINQND